MAKKKKEKSFSSFVNNPIDFTLLITILLLLSMGLVMVLSASSPSALSESGNSYAFFSKQLIFAILGIIAMLFISKIDYRFYQKFYKHAWWIALILLALVLIAGKTVNGAKRWIFVTETLSFQPSEVVKILMIIFYAGILGAVYNHSRCTQKRAGQRTYHNRFHPHGSRLSHPVRRGLHLRGFSDIPPCRDNRFFHPKGIS